MVARTLVDQDIRAGRRLVEELDKGGPTVKAVLWFYLSDQEDYRLLIAMPIVDQKGPLAAYRVLQRVLDQIPEEEQPAPSSISVVSPSDGRIKALRKVIKAGKGILNIRFTRNTVGDLFVEDALIYRLN